ncbi:MAG: hypothetical protein E7487_03460 [Ruminococcaceae bacterium]|nr:hypothetical protein [Oscillospiraceae bacterium]
MAIPKEQMLKLESMQIKGIRWMIWKNIDRENIESRLLGIKGQTYTSDIEKFVNSQSRAILIKLVDMSPEITTLTIDAAYEKYRYGLKPGFTLFWAKGHNQEQITQELLEDRLKTYISELKFDENAKYKNLEYVSMLQFDGIYEVTLSYLQRFNYIDENGEFTFIYMLKECFIWIGIDKGFVALNNLPESLMTPLKRLFSRLYKTDITNVKITNGLLKHVFSENNERRVTRQSPNPPANQLEKIVYADPNLSEKKDCIPPGYENYDVTNTQYTEEIDASTSGTLGVNCKKGKLYLSKSLTSSQFRTWSIRRITDIIGYYKNSTDVSMDAISGLNMFSSSDWEGLTASAIQVLNQIAYGIVSCKKIGDSSFPLQIDLSKIRHDLNKFFFSKVSYICSTCEEKVIPSCTCCGHSSFAISSKGTPKIVCPHCASVQEGPFSFCCENGHTETFDRFDDVVEFVATDELCEKIKHTISLYFPVLTLLDHEYFTIHANGIDLQSSPTYEKLNPSDIPAFADIVNRPLITPIAELDTILYSLKEKCAQATKENCAKCKMAPNTTSGTTACMLCLFTGFEGFIPQPHQGHEFGDVSFLVNHKGQNMTFVGLAKSVPTGRTSKKITKASDIGREIIQQSLDAFDNCRADIVGIIYPYILDDNLKHLLYHHAKLSNKRLVILDYEFMAKLLDKYIEDHPRLNASEKP